MTERSLFSSNWLDYSSTLKALARIAIATQTTDMRQGRTKSTRVGSGTLAMTAIAPQSADTPKAMETIVKKNLNFMVCRFGFVSVSAKI